jgi:hypothetical protein
MPLINIVKGNHILGALIGAAVSAPSSAWIAYGFLRVTGLNFDVQDNPAWLITGVTACLVLYGAIAFGVSWAIGGDYETYKRNRS